MAQRRPPAAKRESLFPKIGARVNLQPQSMAQFFVDVRNESQLLSAVATLAGSTGNCYGKGINVVAPITLTQALVLTAGLNDGLTISSPGRAAIDAAGFGITVAADDVVIQDLAFTDLGTFTISGARAGVSGVTFTNTKGFSITGADAIIADIPMMTAATGAGSAFSVNAIGVSISDVRVAAGDSVFTSGMSLGASAGQVVFEKANVANGATTSGVLVASPDAVSEIWVLDCFFPSGVAATAIEISGQLWVVRGNRLSSSSDIVAGASGGSAVINGNLFINEIDTSAGTGLNAIVGNVEVTTITSAGSDQVGLNT